MSIPLNDVLQIASPHEYKLHLACWNGECHPLDEFVACRDNWIQWNEWRGRRNDWTRPHILSFMEFYHQRDAWLFGGVFEVVERHKNRYILREHSNFEKYVGRLVASFSRSGGMRGRAFKLESYLDRFTISQILPRAYSGERFPGFEHINHSFADLEAVFRAGGLDWKAALESVKGVYLVSDKSNGKKYVGSAYGDAGIWSRWASYIESGHGGNDDLLNHLRAQHDPRRYAREHFRFSVLEVVVRSTPDDAVLKREAHWKRVLLTREHGYNKN